MSWTILIALVLGLGLALFAALARRVELARMKRGVVDRERSTRAGGDAARLQHPVIDLTRCMGCGACVQSCPEKGVLELVHGQAMVVNAARCTGISVCERVCPVDAITVTLTDAADRRDIPAISADLEAVGTPGLFLAGEVTAQALIKTAIEHGTAVADEVARRVERDAPLPATTETLDLCVVGAGPAGLACSLEARRHGLSFVTIDQERGPGGTVAKYPRRKLVMTQPVDLPLYGRLEKTSYTKEELMELWQRIALQEQLPIHGGQEFENVTRDSDGTFLVRTKQRSYRARNVCLALGRRGTPRKLGVPGEDLPKVAYSLVDAAAYQGRRILVVGGGDSAVEAAVSLAAQPGNQVLLSYRKEAFFRIRLRNEEALQAAVAAGAVRLLLRSEIAAIRPDSVDVAIHDGPSVGTFTFPNDEVFVMAGGTPPLALLARSGVSFDPALRAPIEEVTEQGTGLLRALGVGFGLAVLTLGFALWHADYYSLPIPERPVHAKFETLRPSSGLGLLFGIAAASLVVVNLLYLLRKAGKFGLTFGSLRGWMTSHVATGILALSMAVLHGGMAPRDTVGGHALWALAALLVTGAIGRYFYAYVPRAANGRELELEETRKRLEQLTGDWDANQRGFAESARTEILRLIEERQWTSSFFGRVRALFGSRRDLERSLSNLRREGRGAGVPHEQVEQTLALARQAWRAALMAAHYEDLRAMLNTWRYLHRWVAALMIVLLLLHIGYALVYGSTTFDGGGP